MANERIINHIENFCDEYGYDYQNDYSGRFMYGATCPAIRTDGFATTAGVMADLMEYILVNGIEGEEHKDLTHAVRTMCKDSLGLGIVVYFPILTA